MANYSETKLLEGLMAHLVALGLSEPIAFPNVNFKTPSSGSYIAAYLLPAITRQLTLGADGENRLTGLFQVSIFSPVNEGITKATELAGQIAAHFKRGTNIIREGEVICIVAPPYINTHLQEKHWFITPLRIEYQSDISNP